jgi:DNA-binding CsgD family transcriptional regulator
MTESSEIHFTPEEVTDQLPVQDEYITPPDNIIDLGDFRTRRSERLLDQQILRDQRAIELLQFRSANQGSVVKMVTEGKSAEEIAVALEADPHLVDATIAVLRRKKAIPGIRELNSQQRSQAIEQTLAENPNLSLRRVAKIHDISHETARKWIERGNLREKVKEDDQTTP